MFQGIRGGWGRLLQVCYGCVTGLLPVEAGEVGLEEEEEGHGYGRCYDGGGHE